MIDMKWLLNQAGFEGMKCVCAKNNLSNAILGVHIMDNPDTYRFFKKGELAITTGYIFQKMDEPEIKQVISGMSERGCCGIVFKVNRFYDSVPCAIVEKAETLKLPILTLPYNYTLSEVQMRVLHEIFASEMKNDTEKRDMYIEISNLIFQDARMNQISSFLENYFHTKVAFLNIDGRVMAVSDGCENIFTEREILHIKNSLKQEDHVAQYTDKNKGNTWFCWKLERNERKLGYMMINDCEGQLDGRSFADIEYILPLIVTLFEKNLASKGTKGNNNIFQYLLDETIDRLELEYLCRVNGFDTTGKHCLIVFKDEARQDEILRELFKTYGFKIFQGEQGGYQVIDVLIAKSYTEVEMMESLKKIFRECNEISGKKEEIKYGISECMNFDELKIAYQQAVQSLIFNQLLGSSDASTYREQKIYHFLYNNISRDELMKYVNDIIKPLKDKEENKNMDYVKTLEVLVMNGWKMKEASEELFIHRNTLLFRKERIFDILGLNDTPVERFYLELGIYAYRIVQYIYGDCANAQ